MITMSIWSMLIYRMGMPLALCSGKRAKLALALSHFVIINNCEKNMSVSEVEKQVYDLLDEMQISYEVTNHPPVFTIEEMLAVDIQHPESVVKNLFLRDDKKKNYYLVVMDKDKQVNLKELKDKLGGRPLRFASEDDLYKYLALTKGAVTPFGVINDADSAVTVVIDNVLSSYKFIGIHPNTNTATVWIAVGDLVKLVESRGNKILFMDV